MKSNLFIKHDVYTIHDTQVTRIVRQMGPIAYALWWRTVEVLYTTDNGSIPYDDLVDELVYSLHARKSIVEKFLYTITQSNYTLLHKNEKNILSNERVQDSLEFISEKSTKAKKSINTRWKKSNPSNVSNNKDSSDTNVLRTNNEGNTNESQSNNERTTIESNSYYERNTDKNKNKNCITNPLQGFCNTFFAHARDGLARDGHPSPATQEDGQEQCSPDAVDSQDPDALHPLFGLPVRNAALPTIYAFGLDRIVMQVNGLKAMLDSLGVSFADYTSMILAMLEGKYSAETAPYAFCPTCGHELDAHKCDHCGQMVDIGSDGFIIEPFLPKDAVRNFLGALGSSHDQQVEG